MHTGRLDTTAHPTRHAQTVAHSVRAILLAPALCLLGLVPIAHADVVVPAGSTVSLNCGSLDLAGTDLIVRSTFDVGSCGIVRVQNIVIDSSGTLNLGDGQITFTGSFTNQGTFNPGTGTVNGILLFGEPALPVPLFNRFGLIVLTLLLGLVACVGTRRRRRPGA